VQPVRVERAQAVQLPGSVEPLNSIVMYPRAQGYVKAFHVDLGDRVKSGQLLAEIETPEIDQQLDQERAQLLEAEARLAQVKASRDLSHTVLERYRVLGTAGAVSKQDFDQRSAQALVDESHVQSAQAAIAVQRAKLRRLTQIKAFALVRAPFAGIIAARTIDLGALVSVGNVTPLFTLLAADSVRVSVQVPQDAAPGVHSAMRAKVTVREYPERTFEGEVTRRAGALDPATRTMRIEVHVPNPDGALLTGMYAQVALETAAPHAVYELPSTAVTLDEHGPRVALVDAQQRIRLRQLGIERDLGATIQIARGLEGGERVVKLASAALVEGQEVQVLQAATPRQ
jgi:membrane fusion protein, multidrug efflux system